MNDAAAIYPETKNLKPAERLRLVEMLLADLDQPDDRIDRLWAAEAQNRWDAYQRGELKAVSHEEVMAKYRRRWKSSIWMPCWSSWIFGNLAANMVVIIAIAHLHRRPSYWSERVDELTR